ncbi:hypothetical protein ACYPKM_00815 [Pseudomonas aeruginosa]
MSENNLTTVNQSPKSSLFEPKELARLQITCNSLERGEELFQAASQGDVEAMLSIGYVYQETGIDKHPDLHMAEAWFQLAAQHGSLEGQAMLMEIRQGIDE